jgi:hypothetical protein
MMNGLKIYGTYFLWGILFCLPVIESFHTTAAFALLLIVSLLLGAPVFLFRKISFDRFDILFLGVLIIFTVSTLFSISLSRSYIELLRYFAYFLIFISVRHGNFDIRGIQTICFSVLIASGFFASVLFLLVKIPIFEPLILQFSNTNLIYSGAGHSRLAELLIFILPFIMIKSIHSRKKSSKIAGLSLTAYFIFVLFLCQSRAVVFCIAISFLFYGIKHRLNKSFALWISLFGIFTIIYLIAVFVISDFIPKTNLTLFLYKPIKNEYRLIHIQQAIQGFIASPLYGNGLDTYRYISEKYKTDYFQSAGYAHNHFIEIFTDTGLFGGLWFLLFIGIVLHKAHHSVQLLQATSTDIALFISVLSTSLHSLFDFDWHFISLFLLFWIFLGLLLKTKTNTSDRFSFFFHQMIYIIIFMCFLTYFIFPLDTDVLLRQAQRFIENKDYTKARFTLEEAHRLDSPNDLIWEKMNQLKLHSNY